MAQSVCGMMITRMTSVKNPNRYVQMVCMRISISWLNSTETKTRATKIARAMAMVRAEFMRPQVTNSARTVSVPVQTLMDSQPACETSAAMAGIRLPLKPKAARDKTKVTVPVSRPAKLIRPKEKEPRTVTRIAWKAALSTINQCSSSSLMRPRDVKCVPRRPRSTVMRPSVASFVSRMRKVLSGIV